MKSTARYILAVLLFHGGIVPSNGAAAQETWALMGRHGGCHSFAEAAARKPIFEGVVVPDDLTANLFDAISLDILAVPKYLNFRLFWAF